MPNGKDKERYERFARSVFTGLSVTGSSGVYYDTPEEREGFRQAILAESRRRGIPVKLRDEPGMLSAEYADADDDDDGEEDEGAK